MNQMELQVPPESGFVRMVHPDLGDDSVTDVPEEAFNNVWSTKGWQLYGSNAATVSEAPVEEEAPALGAEESNPKEQFTPKSKSKE